MITKTNRFISIFTAWSCWFAGQATVIHHQGGMAWLAAILWLVFGGVFWVVAWASPQEGCL